MLNNAKYIMAVFTVGLVIRLAYVLLAPQIDLNTMGDPAVYTGIARNLAEGRGYTSEDSRPDIFWAPGYPFFLAAIYKISGVNNTAVRVAQAFLGSFVILFVYYAAAKVFDNRVALLSAIITSIYPGFIGYSGIILPQLLTMFLICAFISLLLNYKTGILSDALLGAAAGFSALVRPELLYFWLLLLALTIVVSKVKTDAVKRALTIFMILYAIVSVWTVRNYRTFGKFIPVSMRGDAVWISTWHEEWLEWKQQEPSVSLAKGKTQIDASEAYFKAGVENVKAHPFIYARMCLKRLYRLWSTGYSNTFDFMKGSLKDYFVKGDYGVVFIKSAMLCANLFIVMAGFLGMFIARRKFPGVKREIAYLSAPIIFFIVFHFFLFATPRYAIPVMPFMIIFASAVIYPVAGLAGRPAGNDYE